MLRWGVLSTARIAEEFVRAVREDGHSTVAAISSRDKRRAADWAARHDVATSYGSYAELLESKDIDAVYIPLPNSLHVEWTIRSLEAGKHVLVEKPMALTADDVDRLFEAAARAGRLVMEGFMFCHHPLLQRVTDVAASGDLGEIVTIRAWHGFTVEDTRDIRFDRSLGGGALYDLGCYCVAGSLLFISGLPDQVQARQAFASDVDVSTYALLGFGDTTVLIDCSMRIPESAGLQIVGTRAEIEVPQPWFPHLASEYWLVRSDGRRDLVACEPGDSYALEIGNFCEAVEGLADPRVSSVYSRRIASTLQLISEHARGTEDTLFTRLG